MIVCNSILRSLLSICRRLKFTTVAKVEVNERAARKVLSHGWLLKRWGISLPGQLRMVRTACTIAWAFSSMHKYVWRVTKHCSRSCPSSTSHCRHKRRKNVNFHILEIRSRGVICGWRKESRASPINSKNISVASAPGTFRSCAKTRSSMSFKTAWKFILSLGSMSDWVNPWWSLDTLLMTSWTKVGEAQ